MSYQIRKTNGQRALDGLIRAGLISDLELKCYIPNRIDIFGMTKIATDPELKMNWESSFW